MAADAVDPAQIGAIGLQHAGLWECELGDSSLIWSGGVYDMFGLERRALVSREQALRHFTEDSRTKLERLRADAITQKLGFTIDVEIRAAAVGEVRRLRVVGAPVCERDLPVRLHGVKLLL